MIRHLLTGEEFDHDAMMRLFDLTAKIKRERFSPNAIKPLAGKSIGVIFAKIIYNIQWATMGYKLVASNIVKKI